MLIFDIEIAKLPSYEPDDYEMHRQEIDGFDFAPECNQIVCISYALGKDEPKSLVGEESQVIKDFFYISKNETLLGFNSNGFDIPFIVKRAVILGIIIPNHLKLNGKKPWEVTNIVDIYLVWKHLGHKSCKLDLICGALGIPSPKDKIDGSQVDEYFREGRIKEIAEYCEKDVNATREVARHFYKTNLM